MAAFGVDARIGVPGVDSPAAVARLVTAAAAREGESFCRRLVGAYVVAEPCLRFGLIPRSPASVVRPSDWEQLVLEHYDQLPTWTEREFTRWLNGLIAERTGVHRPGPGRGGPSSGEDAMVAPLAASISVDR